MRSFLFTIALLSVAGCASSGAALDPEIEPFAVRALQDDGALVGYLTASGVNVTLAQSAPDLRRPQVVRSTLLGFAEGGRCEVLAYESASDAEYLGPKSGGGGFRVRRAPTLGRRTINTAHRNYKPTHLFGRFVAVCSGEPAQVAEAFRKLQAYAEARE